MLVVDTSVAIKWVVEEQGSREALRVLRHSLIAPDLFQAEVANVLTKKVRRREMGVDQARAAFAAIRGPVSLLPSTSLGEAAFDLSLLLDHSVYDCVFLAAAEANDRPLITADETFVRKTRGRARGALVRLLGEEIEDE